jgi:hypothetical protein
MRRRRSMSKKQFAKMGDSPTVLNGEPLGLQRSEQALVTAGEIYGLNPQMTIGRSDGGSVCFNLESGRTGERRSMSAYSHKRTFTSSSY